MPAAPRRNLHGRPRPKRRKRRHRLIAVAIDPRHAGDLHEIRATAATTPTRNHADKNVSPIRQRDDRLNDAIAPRDIKEAAAHTRANPEANLNQRVRRRRAIQRADEDPRLSQPCLNAHDRPPSARAIAHPRPRRPEYPATSATCRQRPTPDAERLQARRLRIVPDRTTSVGAGAKPNSASAASSVSQSTHSVQLRSIADRPPARRRPGTHPT